jgi:hypothetical protein
MVTRLNTSIKIPGEKVSDAHNRQGAIRPVRPLLLILK